MAETSGKKVIFGTDTAGRPFTTTHPEEAAAMSGQKSPGELRVREEDAARREREAQGATPGARAVDQEAELAAAARKRRAQEERDRGRALG